MGHLLVTKHGDEFWSAQLSEMSILGCWVTMKKETFVIGDRVHQKKRSKTKMNDSIPLFSNSSTYRKRNTRKRKPLNHSDAVVEQVRGSEGMGVFLVNSTSAPISNDDEPVADAVVSWDATVGRLRWSTHRHDNNLATAVDALAILARRDDK